MAAVLSADMQNTDKIVMYVDECHAMGLKIVPPDVNVGHFNFTVNDSGEIVYGLGAIKAVSAASLSLRGDGTHLVPLDACVETMRQTGEDMINKYKETSLGGLAVNIPNC